MSLQFYYDHTYFSLPYSADPPAPPFFSGFPASALTDTLDTYDGELQHQFAWGQRQKLVWGLGLRLRHEVDHNLSIVRFEPPVLNHSLYDGFVQDAIQLTGGVFLTVGSKLEHNDYTGLEVEPSVRLQWSPDENQLLWAAVSRAVRTPSRYDRALRVPTGLVNAPPPIEFPTEFLRGSADFVSETLVAYELGYRAILGARATGSLSLFYNDYDHLRSTTSTPTTALYPFPFPVYFQNNLEGETHGLEVTSTYKLLEGWQLHLGYDLLLEDLRVKPGEVDASGTHGETADPKNQLFLRSSTNLPHNVTFDAALRWIDTLYMEESPTSGAVVGTVPSYYALDVRLAWQASRRLEVSLVGHNLLHASHPEYGYPSPEREQIARSVFGRVTWGY